MNPNTKHALDAFKSGKDRLEVKATLQALGLSQEEQEAALKEADDLHMNDLISSQSKPPLIPLKVKAYLLIILGVGLSLATYTGLIDLRGGFILWYGPPIAGLGMLTYDRREKRKKRKKD